MNSNIENSSLPWDSVTSHRSTASPNANAGKRAGRACLACRAAKTKCSGKVDDQPCSRCATISIACVFTPSRRGRVPGTKNRRTSGQSHSARPSAARSVERSWQDISGPHRSGAVTPLDSHSLMLSLDENSLHNRLTSKAIHLIEEDFPVGTGPDLVTSRPSAHSHDPLFSIPRLAKTGWDVLHHRGNKPNRTVLPEATLPPEDSALLARWTPEHLESVIQERTLYFQHGPHGSKRDVAPLLDPVHREILTESQARHLVDSFFRLVHPQLPVLDPALHNLEFVRGRSALLTTTILAVGATAISTLPGFEDSQVALARKLHTHAEKLQLVVYTTGAKSVDIVQAHVLMSRFGVTPPTRLDERRTIRTAAAARMAIEIGLDLHNTYPEAGPDLARLLQLNDIRAKIFISLSEYKYYTFTGKDAPGLSRFELSDTELGILGGLGASDVDRALPAYYHLYLFERASRRRLEDIQGNNANLRTVYFESERLAIQAYIDQWMSTWCRGPAKWHLQHEGRGIQFLLLAQIARFRVDAPDLVSYHQHLLSLSLQILQDALESPNSIHMTHRPSSFSFASTMILRSGSHADLVLRIALRLAAEPGRPFVPSYIRNAGNEIFAMLCASTPVPSEPEASTAGPVDLSWAEIFHQMGLDGPAPGPRQEYAFPYVPGPPAPELSLDDLFGFTNAGSASENPYDSFQMQ